MVVRGIREMFDELSGGYADDQLEVFAAHRRERRVENVRQWRAANPGKARALSRRSRKAWGERNREHLAEKARLRYARRQDREHLRSLWREAAKRYRAKRKR